MAFGQQDIINTVGLEFSAANQQYNNFARSLPPIRGKVDFTGLGTITRQAGEFERALGAAQARTLSFGLAAGSIYGVIRAFEELVHATIDVQKDLANINVVLGLSSGGLVDFSNKLFAVANLTGQSFKDVAETALTFSRQGLGTTEVLKRTADAMTLVRIGGTDLDTSIKAITATLNTFNEVGLDSTKILNTIATVDTKFSVTGNVIAEALTRAASTAKDAGVSFNSLIGITTALQQITSRGGNIIGNSLKSIFQRIQRPEVIDQLNQMGIATEDLNGQMLSADKILTNLAKSYGGLSQAQQAQITQIAAGLFQANQFKAIIGDLAKENGIAARATETASNATDQAARRQAALNQTLASQLQVSLNNLQKFGSQVGNVAIAPALQNIFKGINFLTDGEGFGKELGDGLLKGLGNFLSGPGLALAGTLAAKFFLQFSTYATKSLSTVLETNILRYQQEQAISTLLQNEPKIIQEIVALGNNEVAVQQLLLSKFAAQTEQLNQQVAAARILSSLTSVISPNSFVGSFVGNPKPLSTFDTAGGSVLGKNPSFVPRFSALSNALTEAVNREQLMGVSKNDIRIGTSNALYSPDNPLGLGVYNTKDEPLGLDQGVQRAHGSGIDPKRAGIVPNFAPNYYQNINSSFKDPFNRPPGNSLLGLDQSIQLENSIKQLKESFKIGNISQDALNAAIKQLTRDFNLTDESSKQLSISLQQSKNYYDKSFQQYSYPLGPSAARFYGIESQKPNFSSPFLNPITGEKRNVISLKSGDENFESQRIRDQARSFRFTQYGERTYRSGSGFIPTNIGIGIAQNTDKDIQRQNLLQLKLQENKTRLLQEENKAEQTYLNYINKSQSERIQNSIGIGGTGIGTLQSSQLENKVLKSKLSRILGGDTKLLSSELQSRGFNIGQNTSVEQQQNLLFSSIQGGQAAKQERDLIIQQQKAEKIQQEFEQKARSLNLGSIITGRYGSVEKESQVLNQGAIFNNAKTRLTSQALITSFIAPLLAGEIQNLIPQNSTTSRGVGASVGALGNIASYSALGFTLGGPYGAAGGAALGGLLELPKAIKAFSDTLPDLQKHLDSLKDSTTKINDSFSGYISTSEQLSDIQEGNQKVSVGVFNQLLQKQTEFLNKLPTEAQNKIKQNPEDIYEIASSYQTIGQQNINALQDIVSLRKSQDSDYEPIIAPLSQQNIPKLIKEQSFRPKSSQFSTFPLLSASDYKFNPTGGNDVGIAPELVGLSPKKLINQNLKPFANSILDFQNSEGLSLDKLLQTVNPKEVNGLNSSNLPDFLKKHDFSEESVQNISDLISSIKEKSPGGTGGDYINQLFSQNKIQERSDNAKPFLVEQEKQVKELDDLNSKLASLTVTGTEAINSFEINVIDRLSKSLTQLKLNSISEETAAKISEIGSGKNDYVKAYFDYTRQNSAARTKYGEENLQATSNFSNKVGGDFYSVLDNFTKGLGGTGKDKVKDLHDLVDNKVAGLNEVLKGFFNISNKNNTLDVQPLKDNYSPDDIKGIISQIHLQIDKNDIEKRDIPSSLYNTASDLILANKGSNTVQEAITAAGDNGKELNDAINSLKNANGSPDIERQNKIRGLDLNQLSDENTRYQNLDEISKSYQGLLEKLTEDSANLDKSLVESKNTLQSSYLISVAQLNANLKVLQSESEQNRLSSNISSSLSRSFSAKSSDLSILEDISNRVSSITLSSQRESLPQQKSIIDKLNQNTGLNFGIGATTNPSILNSAIIEQSRAINVDRGLSSSLYGDLASGKIPLQTPLSSTGISAFGNIESIKDSQNELKNIELDRLEKVKEALSNLSPFTDDISKFVKNQNIQAASQGTLTSANFISAGFAPLQYNKETFSRDAVVGLQEFSEELKGDLSDSLLSITRGARTASKAMTDLGLALASNLAKKATDIGINSLFGLGTKGLGEIFPAISSALSSQNAPNQSNGGYIPKFSSGGMVNMGSGTKDDVPAYLSGGEFVINKNAVKRIGKNNLDLLNNSPHFAAGGTFQQPTKYISSGFATSPGITTDSINIGSNSTNLSLANAFVVGSSGNGGKTIESSLLSGIGQSSDLNPQNKLKFARQKYAQSRGIAYQDYLKQLDAYKISQDLQLGQAALGAAGSVAGGIYSGIQNNAAEQSQSDNVLSEYAYGSSPILTDATFSDSGFGGSSGGSSGLNFLSLYNSVLGTSSKVTSAAIHNAGGGYIPKFASGGSFGGDSGSDRFRAMVMGGEYVVNPKTVNKYGTNFFKSLNNTAKYASGGYVGDTSSVGIDSTAQIIAALNQIKDKLPTVQNNNTTSNQATQNSAGQTNHVTVNISMASDGTAQNKTTNSSSSGSGNSTQSQNKEAVNKVADNIQALIVKELTQSSRPGGLLYQTFSKKQ